MIPDELIEEVRQRADLVEIVSEHTRLKRSGKTFRGPCPLHGGEGPNFSVDPAQGFFKCFVCGEGGTVFTFLMKHLGMSYPDAVRSVAERVGIAIPDPREERREEDPNRHFHEVNAFAAEWFRRQLWEEEGGVAARDYLERRGITRAAAERFGLGWAPEAWTALGDAARAHGIANETLLELGLAKESRQGGREPYDAFRGRLIFPIESVGGRVIAFGGRILGSAEEHVPKYLNSPESPVYQKSRVLYGLGWSRGPIRRAETALVVEGYMDFVSLAAHGVENAVAPLGTAMTAEQAELLARYARRVIVLYDSDTAGLKATFRAADVLLGAGVEVLVATLPTGEDPDSLVRAQGADALRGYLDDALDVLDRKIQILERRDLFRSAAGVRRAIDALLPTVRATADELQRGVYLSRIAERTGVSKETLEREAGEYRPAHDTARPSAPQRRGGGSGEAPRRAPAPRSAAPAPPSRHALGPERNLLLLMLRDESWVERAARELGAEHFRDPVYRAIYEGLLHSEGQRDAAGAWLEHFPPEALPALEALRGDPEGEHLHAPEQFFHDNLQPLLARPFEERLAAIEREMQSAAPERQVALLAEIKEIHATMRERRLPIRSRALRTATAEPR